MPNLLVRTSLAAALIVAAGALIVGMVPAETKTVAAGAGSVGSASEPAPSLDDLCRGAAWPYLPAECLHSVDGKPVPKVRWVTIETRLSENESMLLSAPVVR